MSYDETRIRNHYHFHEISGGCYLDQAIHMIDTCNWILGANPLYAIGEGSRKGGPDFGNAWTNYQVIYKYPNDVNVSVHSSKFGKVFGDVCARFIGTKGIAEAHYSGGECLLWARINGILELYVLRRSLRLNLLQKAPARRH